MAGFVLPKEVRLIVGLDVFLGLLFLVATAPVLVRGQPSPAGPSDPGWAMVEAILGTILGVALLVAAAGLLRGGQRGWWAGVGGAGVGVVVALERMAGAPVLGGLALLFFAWSILVLRRPEVRGRYEELPWRAGV